MQGSCRRKLRSKHLFLFSISLVIFAVAGCTTVSSQQKPSTRPASRENTPARTTQPPVNRTGETEKQVAGQDNPRADAGKYVEYGRCGFISDEFRGRPTANGETYDPEEFTASHNTLPFGTICLITNVSNDRSVRVRINDRFQKKQDRIIYVSHSAAQQLGILLAGVVEVKLEVIDYPAGSVRQPNN